MEFSNRRKRRRRKRDPDFSKRAARLAHLKDYCDDADIPSFEPVLRNHGGATLKQPSSVSLLDLLWNREIGRIPCNKEQWQSKMLIGYDEPLAEHISERRKFWRPYATCSIPFTKLCTPTTDAVLAVDRFGSYALALSDKLQSLEDLEIRTPGDLNMDNFKLPALALTFYGIPSHGRLEIQEVHKPPKRKTVAPLLRTVTVLSKSEFESSFSVRNNAFGSSVVTTQTKILVSSDWQIGAAFCFCPRTSRENVSYRESINWRRGSITIFSLPRQCSSENQAVQTFKCFDTKLRCQRAFTMRNLLWPCHAIPFRTQEERLSEGGICNTVLFSSGHLLFTDHATGFRLTWITAKECPESDLCVKPLQRLASMNRVSSKPIVLINSNEVGNWTEHYNDQQDGTLLDASNTGALVIAFEAYVSIPCILEHIIQSRKRLANIFSNKSAGRNGTDNLPEYCYNLLSVNGEGRTADFVIVCKSCEGTGFGIFVTVDLLTQHYYRENKWLQSGSVTDSKSLQDMCNRLALNHRMQECRLGPYSVKNNADDSRDWGHALCRENENFNGYDFDTERGLDPVLWGSFLTCSKQNRSEKGTPPLMIPYSMLYPNCDLVTNNAINAINPVNFLSGRKSPLKLVYC